MIRLSAATDYAIRSLVYMTGVNGSVVTITDIARAQKIPETYLRNTMKKLRDVNMVESMSGRKGGFYLKADPKCITLMDVVVAIEGGPMMTMEGLRDANETDGAGSDKIMNAYAQMQRMMTAYLESVNISMLSA